MRRCGRTKQLAEALLYAGAGRRNAGDLEAARALVEEALALSKALGDGLQLSACEALLATIAFAAGQTAEAIDRARHAVETSRQNSALSAEFIALHSLAAFMILDGQFEPGRAAALRAFELSRALGNAGPPRLHVPAGPRPCGAGAD